MSATELSVPLTDADRQLLSQSKKKAQSIALILTIASVGALALLFLLHTIYWLIALPLFGVVAAAQALVSVFRLRRLSTDLREGQKRVISGPVEAQNVDVTRRSNSDGSEGNATYLFWIQVRSKKLTVTEDQYYQFKKGDVVEAFIAPHSDTVLGINKEILSRPFR